MKQNTQPCIPQRQGVVQAALAIHYSICNGRLVALLHVILFIMLLKATAAALRLIQG